MKNKTKKQKINLEVEHYNKVYSKKQGLSVWRFYEIDFFGEYFKKLDGKKVIEIGCGNGDAIKEITKIFNIKVNYIGIDISNEAIRRAKINYPEGKFVVGDCSSLNFESNSFDAAFCFGVLHHLPDPQFTLKELLRVVKKGGVILLREPSEKSFRKGTSPNERGLNIKKIIKTINDNNGKIIEIRRINPLPIKIIGHIIWKLSIEKYLPAIFLKMRVKLDKFITKIFKTSGSDYLFIIRKK